MPKAIPLVFFGTPEFALPSLAALVAAGHDVQAVICEPPAASGRGHKIQAQPVDVWATAHGLTVLNPEKLKDKNFLASLRGLNCPVFVLAAYGRMLPEQLLAIPPKGVVNVHPSLLPRYRGPAPIVAALRQGDQETGVSIILLDAGMDTGPLLAQEKTSIAAADTALTLSHRLAEIGAKLLTSALDQYINGDLHVEPQPTTTEPPTRFISKENGHADWQRTAVELERDARAFNPWPTLWTTWQDQPLKIVRARVAPQMPGEPGQVVVVDGTPNVVTGDGSLTLLEIQPAGGRVMAATDFLRGHPAFALARLR